ncbi:MAG: 3-dehydroquinate synthase [Gammaproteobacteria bacterium]|mgnify:CR=1 FL=1|jgi:3-dehydroquinate synthase|nr:3-dehydroquinate synthase [Gammaproteobacteria bacterium]MBT4462524.1 3-dehydroquinate synthase [Gammaproteobacteria bacterium]MBT4654771.1 3-dehydroquinate synthase [Gammaproteobacteria bacterium]MBT5116844.1 3-dehydroquinate synthase [Gammaproteobacteria bacterium]MBT5761644.1 3-dehydroquinate synthase [Gammaproteobacteria bacterium]
MKKILFKIDGKNIPIIVGNDVCDKISIAKYINYKDIVIITNTKVAKLHLSNLKKSLKAFNVKTIIFPDGEKYKNISSLNKIHDFLIKNKFNRDLTVIALGGGVIGDLAGFASDTFLRGVNLIHIPTTLLSQVDSSIGGKTGVNHKFGKNLIGSFKHPVAIFIDTNYLKTLPRKEFISGLSEVVKYGVIGDKLFLKWLNKNSERILDRDSNSLIKLITTSVKAKVSVVQKDERESGIRAHLNFGHTLGHAIESSLNYKGISHGEAVSIGMLFASAISVEKNGLNIDEFNLIENTLTNFLLPITIPSPVTAANIVKHMKYDKKNRQGKINFVLLTSIGSCCIDDSITDKYILELLKTFRA